MDEISFKTTPSSMLHIVRVQYISNPMVQGIQKTKFIYHQFLLHIDIE